MVPTEQDKIPVPVPSWTPKDVDQFGTQVSRFKNLVNARKVSFDACTIVSASDFEEAS